MVENQKKLNFKGGVVPALGFGTYDIRGKECTEAVRHALEVGYRHIDTARFYDNEQEVGQGLKQSQADRDEIFLTTKIWNTELAPHKFIKSTEESLRTLKVDHVDLLLVHWPTKDEKETLLAVETLNDCLQKGYAKYVGVSNFNVTLMEKSVALAPIVCNQTEYHPYLHIDRFIDFVRNHDMFLTAYCPLAQGAVFKDEALKSIAANHGKSIGQIVLKWFLQQDQIAMIPKASKPEHRISNYAVWDFELTTEEYEAIQKLDRQYRIINPGWSCDWSK